MIQPIAVMGDPVLVQVAREVTREELATAEMQQVIDDLIQTLKSTTGVGLAAPQIHQSVRIVIVDKPLTVLVNPVVTPVDSVTDTSNEGCLSVPGIVSEVRRNQTVRVQALDRKGKAIDAVWTKFRAIVVQHEVDHLDGILFVTRAEVLPDLPKPQEHPRAMGGSSKRTIVIESPDAVGGNQQVTFQFEGRGRVSGMRIQPGGAVVTNAWLSGVRFKRREYPAGAAEQIICGTRGLLVTAGDQLRFDLRIPKGKRKIIAEADFDSE